MESDLDTYNIIYSSNEDDIYNIIHSSSFDDILNNLKLRFDRLISDGNIKLIINLIIAVRIHYRGNSDELYYELLDHINNIMPDIIPKIIDKSSYNYKTIIRYPSLIKEVESDQKMLYVYSGIEITIEEIRYLDTVMKLNPSAIILGFNYYYRGLFDVIIFLLDLGVDDDALESLLFKIIDRTYDIIPVQEYRTILTYVKNKSTIDKLLSHHISNLEFLRANILIDMGASLEINPNDDKYFKKNGDKIIENIFRVIDPISLVKTILLKELKFADPENSNYNPWGNNSIIFS